MFNISVSQKSPAHWFQQTFGFLRVTLCRPALQPRSLPAFFGRIYRLTLVSSKFTLTKRSKMLQILGVLTYFEGYQNKYYYYFHSNALVKHTQLHDPKNVTQNLLLPSVPPDVPVCVCLSDWPAGRCWGSSCSVRARCSGLCWVR